MENFTDRNHAALKPLLVARIAFRCDPRVRCCGARKNQPQVIVIAYGLDLFVSPYSCFLSFGYSPVRRKLSTISLLQRNHGRSPIYFLRMPLKLRRAASGSLIHGCGSTQSTYSSTAAKLISCIYLSSHSVKRVQGYYPSFPFTTLFPLSGTLPADAGSVPVFRKTERLCSGGQP